ncbi:MAG: hypothetical protein ACLPTF_16630 [Steroidobacteraceae bacterium]
MSNIYEALSGRRQFVVYKLVPKPNGKTDKVPVDPFTGINSTAYDPAAWMTPGVALGCTALGKDYGVGIVLHEGCGIFGLDLDGCLAGGVLTHDAHVIVEQFRKAGAYIETSISGTGVHILASYTGAAPPHDCKKPAQHHFELYHDKRFLTVSGLPLGAGAEPGSVFADCTSLFWDIAHKYFLPDPNKADAGNWTAEDDPTCTITGTDEDRLALALKAKSIAVRFGGTKATFRQLWEADADALSKAFPGNNGQPYDASSADQALCNHASYWWGNNCERILTVIQGSALKRSKWERQDYIRGTILKACALPKVWKGRRDAPPSPPDTMPKRAPLPNTVTSEDFRAYLPEHKYIFIPTGDLWPAASVDKKLLQIMAEKPSVWLDMNRSIEQMTWAPGEPQLILNTVIADGGRIPREGCTAFNLYKPPLPFGDSVVTEDDIRPWLNLLHKIYDEYAEHFKYWFAHRIQRPGEKVNHAIVMGGKPGIGKDSLLAPVAHGIGVWNFREASPSQLLGRFNGFLKSVILRISEARDQGEGGGPKVDRYGFYEHTKTLAAAPPDTLLCDEKNIRAYPIMNVTGLIITTNHKTDGIYLPPDDRRHYVAWSGATQQDFPEGYFIKLHAWYARGGLQLVARYLATLDLSGFDPKATPLKTPAFWAIVDANKPAEDSELADALDKLGRPAAVTVGLVMPHAKLTLQAWLGDRRNSRNIGHRFETAGYEPVRCEQREDGRWRVAGQRQTIYARVDLNTRDRYAAAKALSDAPPPPAPGP